MHEVASIKRYGVLFFFIPFLALPFVLSEYHLGAVLLMLIYIVVAVSFRLVATTGEFTFAHMIVMGIGGYTSALLARYFGLPFWATLPIGGLTAAAFAAVTAYPLFRMRGFYFFIGSLAIGEAVRLIWVRWKVPFGGAGGLWYIPEPAIGNFTFDSTFSYYWLTLGVVAACILYMYVLDKSRFGNTFKAIHLSENLCESTGINTLRYKTIAYVIASFFAGIAGVLLAHYIGSVSPAQFSVTVMIYCLIWVIVGGTNTFWGPIIGVLTLRALEEQLRGTMEAWMPMIYGAILIAVLFALPDGLESLPRKISEWRRGREYSRKHEPKLV